MFFKEWMVKAAGIVGALLAVFGFVKLSNKNAADAREAEINADNLDELLNEIKDAKEIEQTIDGFTDDSKRDRLRKFFNKSK